MRSTSIDELKARAKSLLGEQAYEAAVAMSLVELHRAYSVAHEHFRDQQARGYEHLITVHTLNWEKSK